MIKWLGDKAFFPIASLDLRTCFSSLSGDFLWLSILLISILELDALSCFLRRPVVTTSTIRCMVIVTSVVVTLNSCLRGVGQSKVLTMLQRWVHLRVVVLLTELHLSMHCVRGSSSIQRAFTWISNFSWIITWLYCGEVAHGITSDWKVSLRTLMLMSIRVVWFDQVWVTMLLMRIGVLATQASFWSNKHTKLTILDLESKTLTRSTP